MKAYTKVLSNKRFSLYLQQEKGEILGKKRVNVIFPFNGEYTLQMTNMLSHGK